MYKCIVIDDEPHAVEALERYIQKTDFLTIAATYTDPVVAMTNILNFEVVDLILIDIDMPEISGIELAAQIRKKTNKLIFTTAHTKYGYEAFELEADAYLLKPYTFSKFLATVSRLFSSIEARSSPEEPFFFIKSKEDNHKLVKIMYEDIIAIESRLNYIQVHTLHKSILSYMSLAEISNKLSGKMELLRYQRSFIINKHHIEQVDGNTIKMRNGINITVGDYYRKDFNEFVSKNLIKMTRKA